jgi:hypothetical protein
MIRRTVGFSVTLALTLLAAWLAAEAQPAGKVWRIAFLGDGSAAARAADTLEPFREGLRELGYVEGQNVGAALGRVAMCTKCITLGKASVS